MATKHRWGARERPGHRRVVYGVRELYDRWRPPGTIVYFGGAVHEVLSDGRSSRVREDLTPRSPKRLWKPKWTRSRFGAERKGTKVSHTPRSRRWMQAAFATHKRGSLHRYLRVPLNKKIPSIKLLAAERRFARAHASASGSRRKKLLSRLREVRLALTARRIRGRS